MQKEVKYLLEIVKYILNDRVTVLENPPKDLDWEKLIGLAKSYSILNYVYYGVEALEKQYRPDKGLCKRLENYFLDHVATTVYQTEAARELSDLFEKEGIYALAVKGICTKERYPQSDLRTMGDVDVLYQSAQHAKMKSAMMQMNYEQISEGRQHDCYARKPYLVIEMHRDLMETESPYYAYYEAIWNRVQPKGNYTYIHEMSLEDEYIYNIVHLVRHFQDGGVGIRFVMDVYVYNHIKAMDWHYVETELRSLGLWEFFGNLSKLADKWFAIDVEVEETEVLRQLEQYIVANGTFGSARNSAAVSTARNGRFRGLWKEIFPNLKSMQSVYVWLEKWPVLLPWAWALRCFRSLTSKRRRGNVRYRIDSFKNGDREYGEQLQQFFRECGL